MQQKSILFVTTADTDILTADRALAAMPAGFPRVAAVNPSAVSRDEERTDSEILALASDAGAVVLRLLGGKRAMADDFDALVRHCRSEGIPLIACPGHQEWDEDLVTACTVPAVEWSSFFLMQGGSDFRLFCSLSDLLRPSPARLLPLPGGPLIPTSQRLD